MRVCEGNHCRKIRGATWASGGRTSVLVLESDDFQHANFNVSFDTVEKALAERGDRPDIIVYVETDASPWSAWVFKDNGAWLEGLVQQIKARR